MEPIKVNTPKVVYLKQLDGVSFFGQIHQQVKETITWAWEFNKETNAYTGNCLVTYNGKDYLRTRDELYKYLLSVAK